MSNPPQAVLSVDFELFSHTPAYRRATGSLSTPDLGLEGGDFLRSRFESRAGSMTFFVVASIAETHPQVIEELSLDGHEIASHTYSHRLLTDFDPSDRREELARSKDRLESVTGEPVRGFRAPAFDIGPDHFSMLESVGYDYDSSVVASRRIPGWYGGEYTLQEPAPATAVRSDAPANVSELPVSVMPGFRLPLTGTWLRFFGPRYTILGMKLLARRGIIPVLYVHPWEFVELPPIEGVPKRVYWHTGEWMRRTLQRILETEFTFVPAREALRTGTVRTQTPADTAQNGQNRDQ